MQKRKGLLQMPERDLSLFFNPRSIAILGASQNLASISGRSLYYLREHGYKGSIFPVNPKYTNIEGYTCYPDLMSIPGSVDLALIIVSSKLVYPMLEDCVKKGVPFVTIFSSGFAETGEEGRETQSKIKQLAKSTGIRICGPNCQGRCGSFQQLCRSVFRSTRSEADDTRPGGLCDSKRRLGLLHIQSSPG